MPRPRYTRAHYFQSLDVRSHFGQAPRKDGRALIAAGDFNTKGDEERLAYLTGGNLFSLVRYACQSQAACDFRLSPRTARPWLETQDLQAFFSGSRITVTPVRAELMFHEPVAGERLSDHDGYLVTYRLSWPLKDKTAPFSVAAAP